MNHKVQENYKRRQEGINLKEVPRKMRLTYKKKCRKKSRILLLSKDRLGYIVRIKWEVGEKRDTALQFAELCFLNTQNTGRWRNPGPDARKGASREKNGFLFPFQWASETNLELSLSENV